VSGELATFGRGVLGWFIWLKDSSAMVEWFVEELKSSQNTSL